MEPLSDQKIISSWKKNVQPWVSAIQHGEIKSRLLVTNQAIVNAILDFKPQKVLDVGCGEGWLTRELVKSGLDVLGIDVVPELVVAAQNAGDGRFQVLAYENISYDSLSEKFDVIVCNFSLLGEASVNQVFKQVPNLLNQKGTFIVQTVHPISSCGDEDYKDGWRSGSWAGFSEQFSDPAPWYFRTVESWKALYENNGFQLLSVREPIHPETNEPASLIMMGKC